MFDTLDVGKSGYLGFTDITFALALNTKTYDLKIENFVFNYLDTDKNRQISVVEMQKFIQVCK
jgi:hypothetical protein